MSSRLNGANTMIVLDSLCKTYDSLRAVDHVSLSIEKNSVYGIIGKSGAGKSTLMRLMSLLEKPDSGTIYYNNHRVDNLADKEIRSERRKIGMIFQGFNLFSSRTVAGNIAYPLEIARHSAKDISYTVDRMLELVGLTGRGKDSISTLSGGQKQRVAIARALSVNPSILFCDEATSALDPQTTRSILALIRDLCKTMGLTVVMITHQMEVVRDICDRAAVLDDGCVAEENTVQNLFAQPKMPITKDFLSNINPLTDSSDMVQFSTEGGQYTLRFLGDPTHQPILSYITKTCGVDFNIRSAGVNTVAGVAVGMLIVDIDGEKEKVGEAIALLRQKGITVEES